MENFFVEGIWLLFPLHIFPRAIWSDKSQKEQIFPNIRPRHLNFFTELTNIGRNFDLIKLHKNPNFTPVIIIISPKRGGQTAWKNPITPCVHFFSEHIIKKKTFFLETYHREKNKPFITLMWLHPLTVFTRGKYKEKQSYAPKATFWKKSLISLKAMLVMVGTTSLCICQGCRKHWYGCTYPILPVHSLFLARAPGNLPLVWYTCTCIQKGKTLAVSASLPLVFRCARITRTYSGLSVSRLKFQTLRVNRSQ